jgi:hypothetical protein
MSTYGTAALAIVPRVHGSPADPTRKLLRDGQRPHSAIDALDSHRTLLLGRAVAG